MKSFRFPWKFIFGGLAMMILILDAGTALQGAAKGMELCFRSVIPSLFPFLVLSIYLTGNLNGVSLPLLKFFGKLFRIPAGSDVILLTGLLGGYPTGARAVTQAYEDGQLPRNEAQRMLGFCNNAGPAFIFGMLGPYFTNPTILWILWTIHIFSAVTVGIILPGSTKSVTMTAHSHPVSLPEALERAVKTMAMICGWVILFRVINKFAERWFLWMLPENFQILISGFLELTNGCLRLSEMESESLRFLMACLFLNIGGLCIGMQTISVTHSLGIGSYFPGKVLQSSISVLICCILQPFLFPGSYPSWSLPAGVIIVGAVLFLSIRKNNSSNLRLQSV